MFVGANMSSEDLIYYIDSSNSKSHSKTGGYIKDLTENQSNSIWYGMPLVSHTDGPNSFLVQTQGRYAKLDNTPASLQGDSNFTVCGFFRLYDDYSKGALWGIGGATSGVSSYNHTGTNEISIDLNRETTFSTGVTLSRTDWTFIAWSKSSGTFNTTNIKMFVNDNKYTGASFSTLRSGGTTVDIDSSGIVVGRASVNSNNDYCRAHVSKLMVYNANLSDSRIMEIYNLFKNRYSTDTSIGSYDSTAQSFIDEYVITDQTQKDALNQLVLDMKGIGNTTYNTNIFGKMRGVYPIIGGSSTTHAGNLMDIGGSLGLEATFTGGMTHSVTGIKMGGTNSYMNTNIRPRYDLGCCYNNPRPHEGRCSIGVYVDKDYGGSGGLMGSYNGNSRRILMYESGGNIEVHLWAVYTSQGRMIVSGIESRGLVIATAHTDGVGYAKVEANEQSAYVNGLLVTQQLGHVQSSSFSDIYWDIIVGALLPGDGIPTNYHPGEFRFAFLGEHLEANEAHDMNIAIQRFQVKLDRADPDAMAFVATYSITDDTEREAINQFVLDLKLGTVNGSDLWNDVFSGATGCSIFPFVGSTEATHEGNLILTGPTLDFINGPTHSFTGVYLNGANQFAEMNIIPSTDLSENDISLSIYLRDNVTENAFAMGSKSDNDIQTSFKPLDAGYLDAFLHNNNNDAGRLRGVSTDSSGLSTVTRTSSSDIAVYSNDISLNSSSSNSGGTYSPITMILGGIQKNSTNQNFLTNEIRIAAVGLGMSSDQVEDWNAAVQKFQTTLGRNV